ncbi:MAG: hypothetical protein KDJ38_10175 [Gammaproteobacteria bacterium]|nr:hypothetical protein [Gammaproteobacteria bacterium]
MKISLLLLTLLALLLAVLFVLRLLDKRAERMEWTRLASLQTKDPACYKPEMVAGLPEPAQRFLNFAIVPGTPLLTVAELEMGGRFSLGSRDAANYRPMQARQILAAPQGFVWHLHLLGLIPVSGSDSGRWTRFRLLGLLPVARMGGDPDHARSAFGRYIAESVFWTPAAVLPGPNVVWESVDSDTARVTISHGALAQTVSLKIDTDGRPREVSFLRWSNANTDKTYRLQPFGGLLSDFRDVQGYRLPFRVEAGNLFGSDDYFPFYKAQVTAIRFPPNPSV